MMLRSIIALALLTFPAYGGYARRATVTFPGATTSTQTNITQVFSFSDATFATVANGGVIQNATCTHVVANLPCDFVITDDSTCATLTGSYTWGFDGDYSAAAGTGHVWVLIPSYTTSPKAVSVCYGNAAVNTYQGGARGAEFAHTLAAYHLPDSVSLTAQDFSVNGLDGVITGATATTGQIDGGAAFSGTSQYIAAPMLPVVPAGFTVAVWAKFTDFANYNGLVTSTTGNNANPFDWYTPQGEVTQKFFVETPMGADSVQGATALSSGIWYYLVGTLGAGTITIYVNGVQDGSLGGVDGPPTINGNRVMIGSRDDLVTMMRGALDEARISDVARSGDWIATEYANQLSPPAAGSFTPLGSSGFPVVY